MSKKTNISGDSQGVRFKKKVGKMNGEKRDFRKDVEIFKNTRILYPLAPTTIPKEKLSEAVDIMMGRVKK